MPDEITTSGADTAQTDTAAPATTEAPSPATGAPTFVDDVEAAAERIAAAAEEQESEPGAEGEGDGEPKTEEQPTDEKPKAELAAADEALFSDKALATAAGVKAAAARVRELRAETTAAAAKLEKRQGRIDHDFRVLKNREATFRETKERHLAWHARERETARLLGGHVNMLMRGEPAQVVESLAFLTGRDGLKMYEAIVQNAAGLRQAPDPQVEALQRRLDSALAQIEERERALTERAETEHKQQTVERRKAELLEASQDAAKYPTLAELAALRPREVVNELVSMKREYKKATGTALTDEQAMVQLEKQLALLVKQQGGGAGNPRSSEGQNPGGKSSQSSSTKSPGGVAGIPPSASTRVAPVRPATDEEQRQELTPEYLASIGLG